MIELEQFIDMEHGDNFYVINESFFTIGKRIFIEIKENWDSRITGLYKLNYSTKYGVYDEQVHDEEESYFLDYASALEFLSQLLFEKLEAINKEISDLHKPKEKIGSRSMDMKSKWGKSLLKSGIFWAFKILGLTKVKAEVKWKE